MNLMFLLDSVGLMIEQVMKYMQLAMHGELMMLWLLKLHNMI